jgi:hypothetical protein
MELACFTVKKVVVGVFPLRVISTGGGADAIRFEKPERPPFLRIIYVCINNIPKANFTWFSSLQSKV